MRVTTLVQWVWLGALGFSELACSDAGDGSSLTFDTAAVLTRVEELGDVYAGSLTDDQELPELS